MTRNELIDQAAKALPRDANLIAALVKACKCCTSSGYEPGGGAPYPSECRWCDHEPSLHGETALATLRSHVAASLGSLLADPEQHAELERQKRRASANEKQWLETQAELDDRQRFVRDVVAERDALQARTAELEASLGYWKTRLGEAVAERQARIDAALAVLDEPVPETPHGANAMWKVQNHRSVQVQRIRAALQGDQPEVPGG